MKTNPTSGADTANTLLSRLAAALRWKRRPPPPSPLVAPADSLALMLHALAEEMARLKREGTAVTRSLAEATQAARHMHDAVLDANARLAETARMNTATAEALCLLPAIVNRQAGRIDALSDKAEALLSQPAADTTALHAAIARLEAARPDPALAQGVIAATERLEALAAQHPGDASLHAAIARLEAARPDPALAQGVIAATERLEALAAQHPGDASLHSAIARLEAVRPDPALAEGVIAVTERLEALIADLVQPDTDGLNQVAERIETATLALGSLPATMEARLEAVRPDPALVQGVIAVTERLEGLIAALVQPDTDGLNQVAERIETATLALGSLPTTMEARLDTAAATTLGEVEAKIARMVAKLSRLAATAQGNLDTRLGTTNPWPPEAAAQIRRVS